MKKTYFAKVYRSNGDFVTTLQDIKFDGFRKQVNMGVGKLTFVLPRKFDDFDESEIIKLNNKVDLYVVDMDTGSDGKKIYSGFISNYEPVMDGVKENVSVDCLGYSAKLGTSILKSSDYIELKTDATDHLVTSGNASAEEISEVVKKIIDLYRAEAVNPVANYSASSVETTGDDMTYTFNSVYYSDAINKCLEFAPSGWYWYLDAENIFHLKAKAATAEHSFILGKHFRSVQVRKNMEAVVNRVLVSSGKNPDMEILKLYQDTDSSALYDDRWIVITDNRVSVEATADSMGNTKIAEMKDAKVMTKVEILDNNGNSNGYDIESIEVGDTCKFLGFNDVTARTFTDNMQIVAIDYTPDKVILQLEDLAVSVGRNLVATQKSIHQENSVERPEQYGVVRAPQGAGLVQVGTVVDYAGSADPNGWLICDGRSLLRTDYVELFSVIGTTYGAADGTHFNIPDCRGRTTVGKSSDTEFDALGKTGGAKTHTLTISQMPSHTHTQNAHHHTYSDRINAGISEPNVNGYNTGGSDATRTTDDTTAINQNTGGDGAHNNLQPYITLNKIIKI